MIDINIYESQTCKTVSFGRKGENLARRILFDLSALIAEFGTGSFEWVIRRPHESTVYIAVNKEQDGNTAILNLTATETAISGYGGFELRYYVDDVIVKTIVWRTSIAASLGTNEVPEPIEDYIDRMHEIAQEASESADAAGDSATQAAASAANAANSATDAAGYASNAAASASAAHTSEVNAANSASLANESATQAAGSASAASDSASAASGSAATAAQSATQAANSATQAAQSATAASSSAQDIAASATQIETNKNDITDLKNHLNESVTDLENQISQNAIPIINSASGAIASFNDGADDAPVKDLVVNIEPVQSGSGDPSPDNVRPISGWTGAKIYATGKNLYNPNGGYTNGSGGMRLPNIKLKPNTYYTCTSDIPQSSPANVYYGGGSTASNGVWAGQARTVKTDANGYINIQIRHAVYDNFINGTNWLQIEEGQTATEYEPFGDTYDISFGSAGTVYGGTLDVTTGVLTVDRAMVDLGTLTWNYSTNGTRFDGTTLTNLSTNKTACICSQYRASNVDEGWVDKDKVCCIYSTRNSVFVKDTAYTDAASFKAAMNGVQLVYELATPQTYQLTPTEVKTLLKQNNIFADTGDIASVDYVADTKSYIDNKFAELQALVLENA